MSEPAIKIEVFRLTPKQWAGVIAGILGLAGTAAGGAALHSNLKERVDVQIHERTAVLEQRVNSIENKLDALSKNQAQAELARQADTKQILDAIGVVK